MIQFKAIGRIMGALMFLIGVLMLPAASISWIYNEDSSPIMISAAISLFIGMIFFFSFAKYDQLIRKREGYLIVALSWVIMTLFGMLPFFLSDQIDSVSDAIFETVSGLTTTGASILTDIEAMPKGLLFWRSMTQWIGGLGIIVLTVAIFPLLGIGGSELFVAESPGPTSDKVHPRISETAKRLWYIYVGLTVAAAFLYWAGGMTFYDAVNHALTTLATGGFSTKNASMAFYDSAFIQYVAVIFMFFAGTNFTLIYFGIVGKFGRIFKSDEFKAYTGAILLLTLIVFAGILINSETEVELAFRKSIFQVVSLITTTGFVTDDYTQYGMGITFICFMMLFLGGSAGSTAGGIKFVRHVVFLKNSWLEFKRIVHPRAIVPLIINGEMVTGRIINNIMNFLLIYLSTFVAGSLVIAILGYDLATSLGSVATCLGNVGPAIGEVGPVDNFAFFSPAAKLVLSFMMLLGRLELFTILILFTPFFWRAN
ncbi:TrkH family potassium uptake protein [Algoriphagus mannitolivorans]|uniref:TrkH family potassium uptake protein n=1 Tax=Algoriphagus mannitolivorans TaxID=226504 RepID=UPI00041855B6|nr:potassium transporter TrkG [Algoriphagus mannitolivorans]